MDISDLQDFALVARHRGFGAASRATGRSKATLARRIASLEESLAVRLFERGQSGLRLTAAGSELLASTAEPLRDIEAAAEAVSTGVGPLRGRLRISAAVVFAHAHLPAIATGFIQLHPGVELDVVADDGMVDLVESDFDIVIRANPDPMAQLVGKCIVRTERVAVAAPDHPLPQPSEAWPAVLRSGERSVAAWQLESDSGLREIRLRPAIRFSTLLMIRDAVLHGAGVALLPRTLVEDDLRAGRLTLWGVEGGGSTEIWVLHASRRLVSAKATAFLRHLEAHFPGG
jgi:DNA-binding transcriptional LysR family regulator